MHSNASFLIAIAVVFTLPYLIWRLARSEALLPLVVVQIAVGVALGPELLGKAFPEAYG
jgi:hypothetical protein